MFVVVGGLLVLRGWRWWVGLMGTLLLWRCESVDGGW